MLTLSDVCAAHVAEDGIDFLKIDVEGHERSVLLGGDFRRWRPRVIVIEATVQRTGEPCQAEWEGILLGADYVDAYFDGVNRFYVAYECAALIPTLAIPPNWFDRATPYAEVALRKHIDDLGAHIHHQHDELMKLVEHLTEVQGYVAHLENEIGGLKREILARDERHEQVKSYVAHLLAEIDRKETYIASLQQAVETR